jgi:hypothetical protein
MSTAADVIPYISILVNWNANSHRYTHTHTHILHKSYVSLDYIYSSNVNNF